MSKGYGIVRSEALLRSPAKQEATKLLERLASQVLPICKARSWKIGLLKEMCPPNASLLGMNVNRGMKILIRLRKSPKATSFLPYEQLLDTMLHELCHMQIGPHSADFYKLWDDLRDDCQSLVMKGITGESDALMPAFSGQGNRLGGSRPLRASTQSKRDLARKAAEKRMKRPVTSSGLPLGGAVRGSPVPLKERVRRAALRRAIENKGCVNVEHGIDQLENGMGGKSELVDLCSPDGGKGAKAQAKDSGGGEQKDPRKRKHSWTCWQCTLINESIAGVCAACGAPEDPKQKGWNCTKCTYLNKKEASCCSVCKHREVIVIE